MLILQPTEIEEEPAEGGEDRKGEEGEIGAGRTGKWREGGGRRGDGERGPLKDNHCLST